MASKGTKKKQRKTEGNSIGYLDAEFARQFCPKSYAERTVLPSGEVFEGFSPLCDLVTYDVTSVMGSSTAGICALGEIVESYGLRLANIADIEDAMRKGDMSLIRKRERPINVGLLLINGTSSIAKDVEEIYGKQTKYPLLVSLSELRVTSQEGSQAVKLKKDVDNTRIVRAPILVGRRGTYSSSDIDPATGLILPQDLGRGHDRHLLGDDKENERSIKRVFHNGTFVEVFCELYPMKNGDLVFATKDRSPSPYLIDP